MMREPEAYCEWIVRQCARWGIPCQPEWLEPAVGPYPDAPEMGPIARARQDRALAKMQEGKRA
jgi:hypothetical protein